jgi:hypothetical protein
MSGFGGRKLVCQNLLSRFVKKPIEAKLHSSVLRGIDFIKLAISIKGQYVIAYSLNCNRESTYIHGKTAKYIRFKFTEVPLGPTTMS